MTHNEEQLDQDSNYFDFGIYMEPHLKKKQKGGEDSAVLTNTLLVVADGVGGWNRKGIDPARYSRQLCQNILDLYKKQEDSFKKNPRNLLTESVQITNEIGTSTCLIVQLDKQEPKLYTSNIGDCQYIILRKQEDQYVPIYKSEMQEQRLNCPYAVGTNGVDPLLAEDLCHNVQDNDLVVIASDGLWDNIYQEQVVNIIQELMNSDEYIYKINQIARILGEKAYLKSIECDYLSPFAARYQKKKPSFKGGKPDDITIVIGQVKLQKQFQE